MRKKDAYNMPKWSKMKNKITTKTENLPSAHCKALKYIGLWFLPLLMAQGCAGLRGEALALSSAGVGGPVVCGLLAELE